MPSMQENTTTESRAGARGGFWLRAQARPDETRNPRLAMKYGGGLTYVPTALLVQITDTFVCLSVYSPGLL